MNLKLCAILFLFVILQSSAFAEPSTPSAYSDSNITVPEAETFPVTEAGLTIIYPKGTSVGSRPHRMPDRTTGALSDVEFSVIYGDIWLQEIKFHSLESVSAFAKAQKNRGNGGKEALSIFNELGRQKKEFQEQTGYESIGDVKYRVICRKADQYDFYVFEGITFVGNVRVTVVMGSKNECEKSSEEFRKILSGVRLTTILPNK